MMKKIIIEFLIGVIIGAISLYLELDHAQRMYVLCVYVFGCMKEVIGYEIKLSIKQDGRNG